MIRQYAFDPACIRSLDSFCRFMDQIGISNGRLFADLPFPWRNALLRQLENLELEQHDQNAWKRITTRMRTALFASKFAVREQAKYQRQIPWIDNIIAEHRERPFDAIIAECRRPEISEVVHPDDATEEHPRWRVERTKRIRMTAAEIISTVKPLLRVSAEVLMVDPYLFHLNRRTQTSFLSPAHFATVEKLAAECRTRVMSRVEYHCSDCDGRLEDTAVEEFVKEAHLVFPANLDVVLHVWPKRTQHNRMILTDLGGVLFCHGLDECTENYLEFDDVALMDQAHWERRWDEYCGHAHAKPVRVISIIRR